MADHNSTLESHSSQVNFSSTRKVTVLETVIDAPSKIRSVGLTFIPVQLEPCIVMRGKWIKDMGFEVGQKLTVTIEHNVLKITASDPSKDKGRDG